MITAFTFQFTGAQVIHAINPLAIVAGRFYGVGCMRTRKPLTIQDFSRMGGLARARKHSKRQIRKWGKLGGRPRKKGSPRMGLRNGGAK
jgi:hypothetical protein